MRLTLAGTASSPDVDLVVPDDVRLGDLRPHLAAVARRPDLADDATVLAVDETVLDADQLTGQVPLLAGAVLRVGIGPVDPARATLRADWHVAVVWGPDCGALHAIDQPVVVGRRGGRGGGGDRDGDRDRDGGRRRGRSGGRDTGGEGGRGRGASDLMIADGGISRRHVELTVGRSGPRARDLGSSNGTVRWAGRRRGTGLARRPRRLRAGGRGVRLRAGDRLALGATVLEIRRGGSTPPGPAPRADAAVRFTAPGAATGDPHPRAAAAPSPATWLGPALGALVLALSTGNRALLALALLGPAIVAWPFLRDRAARPRGHPPRQPGARTGARAHPRRGPSPAGAAHDVVPSPADLSTWAVRLAAGTAPGGTPPGAPGERRRDLLGPRAGLRALAVDGCLAVVGPRPLALAAARALVAATVPLEAAGSPGGTTTVVVRAAPGRTADWAWCRWFEDAEAVDGVSDWAVPGAGLLLVADEPRGDVRLELARRWDGGTGATVLIVETDRARVPPWCRTALTVRLGSPQATLELPDGTVRPVPLGAVSAGWAAAHARRAAALRPRVRPHGEPPEVVALAGLPGIPAPGGPAVAASWAAARHGARDDLAFCLGLGPAGAPVVLDLVRDGPHALVAGTTGAGKSELLQSIVLALALAHSPADLAIALVDYKGGASFGACADLPHVVGQVTDLDQALAARALVGLRAELRLRERTLAAAGVGDLAALRRAQQDGPPRSDLGPPPPRLLVVVDEFRALTEELPTFIPGLLRLAAQGRSLGIHLVLATQRPAGAVGADLRANLALRIALRVTDAGDSVDVLDVPDAARIPSGLPGRALLRRGAAPPEPVQVAHADGVAVGLADAVRLAPVWTTAGLATTSPALNPASGPPIRRATEPATEPATADATAEPNASATAEPPPAPRAVATPSRAFVDAARAAAAATGVPLPTPPWLPPLPDLVHLRDLRDLPAAGHPRGTPAGFPLALADVPAEQRRAVVTWDPAAGNLLVRGAPGSGRSQTLHTAARAALERGWHVHAIGLPERLLVDLAGQPGLGTVVGPDDPRRLAQLVTLLGATVRPREGDTAAAPTAAGQLLVVDGLDATLAALSRVARGAGADRFVDLLRAGRERGVAVAASADGSVPGPIAAHFTDRLVLAVGDRLVELLAEVPADLAGARRGPGRAVRLPPVGPGVGAGDLGAVLCQVVITRPHDARDQRPALPSGRVTPTERPLTLAALPVRVLRSDLQAKEADDRRGVASPAIDPVIGLGGDDAGPVHLEVSRGALVVGPPGSGRSTALAVIAASLLDLGRPIAVIARDGPLRELGDAHAPHRSAGFTAAAVGRLLDALPARTVVLVDDADALERELPAVDERLAALASAAATGPGDADGVGVVASAQTARAAIAYRGTLGVLRSVRRGLVLAPSEPGSEEVLGVALGWVIDPARPHAPGRGARQHGREVVPVQVVDPGTR